MRQKLLHRMKEVCGATSHMMKDELIVGEGRTSSGRNPAFNWRASEASETLSGLFNRESRYMYILEKWFPLQGERAHSLKFLKTPISILIKY